MNKFFEMLRCVIVVLLVVTAITLIVGGGSHATASDVLGDPDPKLVQHYYGTIDYVKGKIGIDETIKQVSSTAAYFSICEAIAGLRVDYIDEKLFHKHMVSSFIALLLVSGVDFEGNDGRNSITLLLENMDRQQDDFISKYTRGKVTDEKKAELNTTCTSMKKRIREIERGIK